jgi:hypothetical protein
MHPAARHPIASVLLALSLATIVPVSVRADTVVLLTGEVLSGRVLRATPEEVSIQLESGGILSFRGNRVERVRRIGPKGDGVSEIVYAKPEDGKSAAKAKSAAKGADPAYEDGERAVIGAGAPEDDEELGSFPLHARRAPSAAPPVPHPEAKGPARYHDNARGYSIVPPPSFKAWSDPKLPPMLKGFMDPATQSNLTISTYESEEPLDAIKEGIVALLPRQSRAKAVREARHDVPGQTGYNGWVLALENTVSDTIVHQTQLIAKDGRRVFIVTFSAADRTYPAMVKAFEASLESFRVEGGSGASLAPARPPAPSGDGRSEEPPAAGSPADESGDDEVDDRLPPEVERHLKGSRGSATPPAGAGGHIGPGNIDTNRIKAMSDKITERVDAKLRGTPYTNR